MSPAFLELSCLQEGSYILFTQLEEEAPTDKCPDRGRAFGTLTWWCSQHRMMSWILKPRPFIRLIPSWQDMKVLHVEAVNAALLYPFQPWSHCWRPLKHADDRNDRRDTADKGHYSLCFRLLREKYERPAIHNLLDICSLLHPRYKLDYRNKVDVVDIKWRQVAKKRLSAVVATTKKRSQQTAAELSVAANWPQRRMLAGNQPLHVSAFTTTRCRYL